MNWKDFQPSFRYNVVHLDYMIYFYPFLESLKHWKVTDEREKYIHLIQVTKLKYLRTFMINELTWFIFINFALGVVLSNQFWNMIVKFHNLVTPTIRKMF